MNLTNKFILILLIVSTVIQSQNEIVVPKTLLDQVDSGNAEAAYFIATIYQTGTNDLSSNLDQAKIWMKKCPRELNS